MCSMSESRVGFTPTKEAIDTPKPHEWTPSQFRSFDAVYVRIIGILLPRLPTRVSVSTMCVNTLWARRLQIPLRMV